MTCEKKGGKIPDFYPNGPTPLLSSHSPSSCFPVEGGFAPVLNGLPAGIPPGHPATGASGAVPPTSVAGGVTSVNSAIQKIAQRYCGDCKVNLSKSQ